MQNSQGMAAAIAGAVIGSVVGYLFFTEHGRKVRRQIEPALEDFARELVTFRNTLQKAAGAANDGWKLLEGALSEVGTPRGQKYPF